jgi:putative ABC transport system ATP-binding protein
MSNLDNCGRRSAYRDSGVDRKRPAGRRRLRFGPPKDGNQIAGTHHGAIVVVPGSDGIVRDDDIGYIRGMTAATGSAGCGSRFRHRGRRGNRTRGPTVPDMDALVQLENVTKRYDNGAAPAVADISLAVAPGEAVAIMGPSGSGKSTLLNLIAGMDRPTTGTVRVGGQQVETLNETGVARFRRRQVGMIFQFFNLLDDMTVIDNVLLPAQLAGVRPGVARARAEELLVTLRIAHRRDAYPARLSGGERQRVAIARALVNRPSVLLADEPTGAVDSATGSEIGALLLELNSAGQTLILVTHNPELAAQYTHRVIGLADGRLASDLAVRP